jgi:hypothetical protein
MASVIGISAASVRRIWQAHGLKPHRNRTFKLSNDPQFAEKLDDIVGLYLNPPEHALVLCVDEKSQIQALDRTQPGLPLKKGRARTMTHDYKRHGTTTLFAALNTLDGKLISTCMDKHRHQEWLRFLRQIDRETPPTNTPRSNAGLPATNDSTSTSPRPVLRGSTWSSASFAISPTSAFAAACSVGSMNSLAPSMRTSPATMTLPNLTSGPPKPPISSRKSSAVAPTFINCNLIDALH